jgi:hypothetical protein
LEAQSKLNNMSVTVQLPKYKCHKEVWALKIKHINLLANEGETAVIFPEEERYAPIEVNKEYMQKHKPKVGGYFVVYQDGYRSFSPAAAFEEGYSKI